MLGSVQVAQPWQQFADELSLETVPRAIPKTQVDDGSQAAINIPVTVPVEAILLSQEVPDQGRPKGRLQGGGSR